MQRKLSYSEVKEFSRRLRREVFKKILSLRKKPRSTRRSIEESLRLGETAIFATRLYVEVVSWRRERRELRLRV